MTHPMCMSIVMASATFPDHSSSFQHNSRFPVFGVSYLRSAEGSRAHSCLHLVRHFTQLGVVKGGRAVFGVDNGRAEAAGGGNSNSGGL